LFTSRGGMQGDNCGGGRSFIHPYLLTHFLQWCCPKFAAEVSIIFSKYSMTDPAIRKEVLEDMNGVELVGQEFKQTEEYIVASKLADELGGVREIRCGFGYADIITDTEVIEVKRACNWKHALGQVLVYAVSFPQLQPRIHLFKCSFSIRVDMERIVMICGKYNVRVTFEFAQDGD
jgi:hypothetical protein